MNNEYRHKSSAWTGRACRMTAQRWEPLPVEFKSGFWCRLLIWIAGH